MLQITFNSDGSIAELLVGESIQQGDHLTKQIYAKINDVSNDDYTCSGDFVLPSGEISQIVAEKYEDGYSITLTEAQTLYAGNLKVNLKLIDLQGHILCTYQVTLKINPTGYNPNTTHITEAQYNSLLQSLNSYVPKDSDLSDLGSGNATENQVLTADGEGGAKWQLPVIPSTYLNLVENPSTSVDSLPTNFYYVNNADIYICHKEHITSDLYNLVAYGPNGVYEARLQEDDVFSALFNSSYYKAYINDTDNQTIGGSKEFSSNVKVPLTPTDNQHATSKKYVDDNIQIVIDTASGRTNILVLSYGLDYSVLLAWLGAAGTSRKLYLYNTETNEFEDKTTEFLNGDYSGVIVINSIFNSTNNYITRNANAQEWIVISSMALAAYPAQAVYAYPTTYKFKIGDEFLVIENDVPDRWFSQTANTLYFYALESKQQIITVDASLDGNSTNPVQNKAVVGGLATKQNTLTAGTGIAINNNVISATGQGDTSKVGSSVTSFTFQYGVQYLIKVKGGEGAYITINGTNYYGAFYFSHYSYNVEDLSQAGLQGPVGNFYRYNIGNTRVSVDSQTTGVPGAQANINVTLSVTNGTMDVYVLD